MSKKSISHCAIVGGLILPVALFASSASGTLVRDLEIAVTIEGVDDSDLRGDLRALSVVINRDEEERFTALAPLRRAVASDAQKMKQALLSLGYYAATVEPKLTRAGLDVDITYLIAPGERFEITDYRIDYTDPQGEARPASLSEIPGLTLDGDPTGDRLKGLGDKLISYLWNNGYPRAEIRRDYVAANFGAGTASAVYDVTTGPRASYGDIRVSGNERTKDSHIKAYFREDEGALYQRRAIDAYRDALSRTSLFREVSVQPAPPLEGGRTDLLVEVAERPHRTIGGGLSFATDVGIGATASWENRNTFRGGELLSVTLEASQPEQQFGLLYEDPLPRFPGAWNATALFLNEQTDAYEAVTGKVGTGIERTFREDRLRLSANIQYTYSDITDLSDPDFPEGRSETVQFLSFPLRAQYNNADDELNPTTGFSAGATVTPFVGDLQFNRVTLSGATRHSFGEDRFILAGRGLVGATLGASGTDLPATERFYAGGGGSVRGYAYQEAGPINIETGNPTGGASITELNLEGRVMVRENIQLAVFADAGTVFESETPDFSGDTLVGAGIGVRYMSPIGPVRLDVATPLDRRRLTGLRPNDEGDLVEQTVFQDDVIQVYIALGQPF
ncbi:hypothetical protein PB2503_13069 [Parvularcula bermudensis HTCC2503]|uniref:POTRA domain-containing protein n=1 Tax=Parvularcula bermudensis (strain ATCC BAA-594 / HTCC2503 / KCTC 12087) TaxID=314260 RepID=E0TG80_PARBH|nr:BamA/TamA family outer membrane protein [Parvularcula bermudensis]ADM10651.1 hypothetical protein PB2503_13069 [Parvularcula bermudensis HTCC2503]